MERKHYKCYNIWNDGKDSRLRASKNNSSPLDLTLVSTDLAPFISWTVTSDCGKSTHFSTLYTLEQDAHNPAYITVKEGVRRNYIKGDWDNYTSITNNFLQVNDNINYYFFLNITNQAAEVFISNKTFINDIKPKNLW